MSYSCIINWITNVMPLVQLICLITHCLIPRCHYQQWVWCFAPLQGYQTSLILRILKKKQWDYIYSFGDWLKTLEEVIHLDRPMNTGTLNWNHHLIPLAQNTLSQSYPLYRLVFITTYIIKPNLKKSLVSKGTRLLRLSRIIMTSPPSHLINTLP